MTELLVGAGLLLVGVILGAAIKTASSDEKNTKPAAFDRDTIVKFSEDLDIGENVTATLSLNVSRWDSEEIADPKIPVETYTADTLYKVIHVLEGLGLTTAQAQDAISEIQNRGILFRESVQFSG